MYVTDLLYPTNILTDSLSPIVVGDFANGCQIMIDQVSFSLALFQFATSSDMSTRLVHRVWREEVAATIGTSYVAASRL